MANPATSPHAGAHRRSARGTGSVCGDEALAVGVALREEAKQIQAAGALLLEHRLVPGAQLNQAV